MDCAAAIYLRRWVPDPLIDSGKLRVLRRSLRTYQRVSGRKPATLRSVIPTLIRPSSTFSGVLCWKKNWPHILHNFISDNIVLKTNRLNVQDRPGSDLGLDIGSFPRSRRVVRVKLQGCPLTPVVTPRLSLPKRRVRTLDFNGN